jgi:TRAP-type mannitol/chloroaromatic compound transport system permease large subunit
MAIGASLALPEMLKRNYDKVMVTGVIQAGSSLGIMVPPSVVLVLYGMIARQPVGQLWLAGVFPGLLLAGLVYGLHLYQMPNFTPSGSDLIQGRAGGDHLGTEVAIAQGRDRSPGHYFFHDRAFPDGNHQSGSMLGSRCNRNDPCRSFKGRLNRKVLDETLKNTLSVSCMFMWVILAALCFGAVFDGLGAVHAIKSLFIERWGLSPWGVLVMMQLSYILMGMFLDDTAMLIIVAPLYVPLVISLGYNPIWYGVLYTITCQIAYMTPPFGYNLFLMKAMAPKEVTLADIYRSIIPFVLVMMMGLGIVMLFPGIALWLPNLYFGR